MQTICVIGAGVVGSSVAYHLSEYSGVQVVVVDSGTPGAGVTSAGTGWITTRSDGDDHYQDFRKLAVQEHDRLAKQMQQASWVTSRGTLLASNVFDNFEEIIKGSEAKSTRVELYSPDEVKEKIDPNIFFEDKGLSIAYFPDEFTVSGSQLAQSLIQASTRNGAISHFGSRVVRIERTNEGQQRVLLDHGSWIDADVVVNAAGAAAPHIASLYEVPMSMKPQPGIGIMAHARGAINTHMITVDNLAIKPEVGNLLRIRSLSGWRSDHGSAPRDSSFTGGLELNSFVANVLSKARSLLPIISRPVGPERRHCA